MLGLLDRATKLRFPQGPETQRGDNMKFVSAAALGTYWLPYRLQFRKRTRSRYENDADDQNSRHRDHQSRF